MAISCLSIGSVIFCSYHNYANLRVNTGGTGVHASEYMLNEKNCDRPVTNRDSVTLINREEEIHVWIPWNRFIYHTREQYMPFS